MDRIAIIILFWTQQSDVKFDSYFSKKFPDGIFLLHTKIWVPKKILSYIYVTFIMTKRDKEGERRPRRCLASTHMWRSLTMASWRGCFHCDQNVTCCVYRCDPVPRYEIFDENLRDNFCNKFTREFCQIWSFGRIGQFRIMNILSILKSH